MNINIQNVTLSLSLEDANVLLRELKPGLNDKTPVTEKLCSLLEQTLEKELIAEKSTRYKVVAAN